MMRSIFFHWAAVAVVPLGCCEIDNTIIFKPDGSGSLRESMLKCKPSDPDSLPFMWAFKDNDSSIYFEDQYYKVRELNNYRFVIYADESLGAMDTGRATCGISIAYLLWHSRASAGFAILMRLFTLC